MTTLLQNGVRRDWILSFAVDHANAEGLIRTTYRTVADKSGVSPSTVRYYFQNHPVLWRAIVNHAAASKSVRSEAKRLGIHA